jgi:uncharacterized protein
MWITALILGLAGSLHCVGMCSPLAMAVTHIRSPFIINKLLYNGGRIFTYGLLGALASSFGLFFQFSSYQNILSITLGCILLLIGVGGISGIKIPLITPFIQFIVLRLKVLFGRFLKQKSYPAITVLGILNGLLPCGLTYLAMTYCLTLQGPLDGFYFMLLFGTGTLPVLLGITGVFNFLVKRFQFNIGRLSTVMFIFLGCLLIARVMFVNGTHHSTVQMNAAGTAEIICK